MIVYIGWFLSLVTFCYKSNGWHLIYSFPLLQRQV
jgi:hypothetical protein